MGQAAAKKSGYCSIPGKLDGEHILAAPACRMLREVKQENAAHHVGILIYGGENSSRSVRAQSAREPSLLQG